MKPFYRVILSTIMISLPVFQLYAQEDQHDHAHHHQGHVELPNEIGGAAGLVYDLTESQFGLGLHLHYTRMLKGKLDKLGFGGGFEAVFMEHTHYNLSAMAVFRPIHPFWISIGPGIAYFTEENQYRISLHIETGYEFDLKAVHLGPMLEYAFAGGDHHFMIGLHVGIPF